MITRSKQGRPIMAWTRTFGWSERFYGMTDTAITAKKTVEVGKSKFLTSASASSVSMS